MPGWMCQCLGRGKETEEETPQADTEEVTEDADAPEAAPTADAVVVESGENAADPTPEAGDTAGNA